MGCACCGSKPIEPVRERPIKYRSQSPPKQQANPAFERISQISIVKQNPQRLIDGYLNEPLVSLEEALQPFDGNISQLRYHIQEAKNQCHRPSEHGLTLDESAAIYIYTMKWQNSCVYDQLQWALKSDERSRVKPWFRYLRLFKSGLDKLPTTKGEFWQGKIYDSKTEEMINSNTSSLYTSLGSCSPSYVEIAEYLGAKHGKKIHLVGYQSINGKVVTGYTANQEKEIIIWPGTKLGVARPADHGDNASVIMHLSGQVERREPVVTKVANDEKHFICQNKACDNRCRGHHGNASCNGCENLFHSCEHHCSPTHQCFNCGRHLPAMRECKLCHSRYCDQCCIK